MPQINLKVYTTNQINKKNLYQIYKLKNYHWKFSLEAQEKWFLKNIKKNDIHIVLFKNKKIIGYNCLRKYKIKLLNFYLFDTLVIQNNYRGKGYSSLIMHMSCKILKRKKLEAILFCNSNLVKFYEKFGWEKKINRKLIVKKNKNVLKFNKNLY